eukprot:3553179-Pleurochrysis_carterae.AAC.1
MNVRSISTRRKACHRRIAIGCASASCQYIYVNARTCIGSKLRAAFKLPPMRKRGVKLNGRLQYMMLAQTCTLACDTDSPRSLNVVGI